MGAPAASAKWIAGRMTKLAVARVDESWDILVDGNGEIFRRFETEVEAERVAQRWRGILSNVEMNGERAKGSN